MSGTPQLTIRPEHLKGAVHQSDQRRYQRFKIPLLGRYLRILTKEEATCRLVDISIGGARVHADAAPEPGERVIISFDELGSLEGHVVRPTTDEFAINFTATHRRRQKLAAQITWLLNRHQLAAADQRRPGHDRIAIRPKPVRIELEDGTVVEHNILNVSISGASVEIENRPPIGSNIVLGKLPAKVVRHHSRGVGAEFAYIQQFDRIREDFS